MTGQQQYMNYKEASEYLGVKIGTLYSWVSLRRIPHVRLSGRMVRFNRDELDQWLADRRIEPSAGPDRE